MYERRQGAALAARKRSRVNERVFSGSPYEPQAGFCRALRRGDRILVAGTAPIAADGTTVAPGEVEPQTRRCLEIILEALKALGAEAEDVVRTRLYLTNATDFPRVARVHGEFFAQHPPVTTAVVVKGLLDPDWRVEIEAEAQLDPRVRALREDDRAWIRENAETLFGAQVVVSRALAHKVAELDGFVAVRGVERLGLATYRIQEDECELVTIDALEPRQGHGTRLLERVEDHARQSGCSRLWLITTNDNLDALRFYQRRGYGLRALNAGAIDSVSRRMKPQIPAVGNYGIAVRDELELEKQL